MIILNTHARTGSYFAHNIIMDNLVKQDKSWQPIWNTALVKIINTMNNLKVKVPNSHNYLKNPIEPFAGLSLDEYGVDHPFGSNFQDIADELHLFIKSHKWPFTIANIHNEKEYADVNKLKEEGYEVVSLYRKDKLKWFLSTILVVANNDVKMFHAYDDESRDYIVNRRKELIGTIKISPKQIYSFYDSTRKYFDNCQETTDKWLAYEDLADDPHSLVRLCDSLDESLEPLQNPLNKQIPHPVSSMLEYFEQPDEFMDIWQRYF